MKLMFKKSERLQSKNTQCEYVMKNIPIYFKYLILLCLCFQVYTAQAIPVVTYYHHDALGSTVAATDEEGEVLWREEYEAYGERMVQDSGADSNTLWYTGKQEEALYGLQYFEARWYLPSVGVFLSRDPVGVVEHISRGNLQGFNSYAYANNNPYKFVDPDGKYAELVVEGISMGMGLNSLANNLSAGNWGAAVVDAVGVVVDGVGMAIPIVPGIASAGIQASRGADFLDVTKGTPSLKDQAKDIRHNLNGDKPTVTIKTEQNGKHLHYDLTGAGHKGVETPHRQHSKANTDNNGVTRYKKQKGRDDVHSMSQQDIRTVRRYLERKDR